MTKAGDWWEARQRGERLPEHEREDVLCELCGEPTPGDDEATFWVCADCIERELEDAPADEPRAEVGLVGSGGGRS